MFHVHVHQNYNEKYFLLLTSHHLSSPFHFILFHFILLCFIKIFLFFFFFVAFYFIFFWSLTFWHHFELLAKKDIRVQVYVFDISSSLSVASITFVSQMQASKPVNSLYLTVRFQKLIVYVSRLLGSCLCVCVSWVRLSSGIAVISCGYFLYSLYVVITHWWFVWLKNSVWYLND